MWRLLRGEHCGFAPYFACDYNPEANVDGDCTLPDRVLRVRQRVHQRCTDGDGVCDELEAVGCHGPHGLQLRRGGTFDAGECEAVVAFGCTDPTMFNYDAAGQH